MNNNIVYCAWTPNLILIIDKCFLEIIFIFAVDKSLFYAIVFMDPKNNSQ
jgi:hypothetical protein